MIICVQIVSYASVSVDNIVKGEIGNGLHILLGVESGDTFKQADLLADKVCSLRVFQNEQGKMDLSLRDVGGEVLIVSQFTLAADTTKGNRPDFGGAEKPAAAEKMYEYFVNKVRSAIGADKVATGVFGANMSITLHNEGPVTVIIKR